MMHLLRKYDVAPLRFAMMRCLPNVPQGTHHSAKPSSLGIAQHHLPKANIIKKRTFVDRQKCVFCWHKHARPSPSFGQGIVRIDPRRHIKKAPRRVHTRFCNKRGIRAWREDSLALRLTSKLADLRAANANSALPKNALPPSL